MTAAVQPGRRRCTAIWRPSPLGEGLGERGRGDDCNEQDTAIGSSRRAHRNSPLGSLVLRRCSGLELEFNGKQRFCLVQLSKKPFSWK